MLTVVLALAWAAFSPSVSAAAAGACGVAAADVPADSDLDARGVNVFLKDSDI